MERSGAEVGSGVGGWVKVMWQREKVEEPGRQELRLKAEETQAPGRSDILCRCLLNLHGSPPSAREDVDFLHRAFVK